MKRSSLRRLAAGLFFLALLAAFLLRAGHVLLPERTDYGAGWMMYLQEPENSIDVLFLGSSVVYCDVIPAVLYEETGLTSYVMAGPEQPLSITLAYLREALKTQRPSVVFLDLSGVLFDRYMGFSKLNIGYMPYLSLNRLAATFRGAEPEERMGLLFPLYNYHERWEGLHSLFAPRADEIPDPLAGYTLLTEAEEQRERAPREYQLDETVFANNATYLNKIQALCEKEGIELVLYQAPTCAWIPETWMERIRLAAGEDARIVDFNESFDTMGLDLSADFYDFLHLNAFGAEKFSRKLGAYLTDNFTVRPCVHDTALWQERIVAYRAGLQTS